MPRRSTRSQSSSQSLSQSTIDQHLIASQVNIKDQVDNCVRYFVNNAGQNAYFRRADIQKHCAAKAGQNFQQVIEKATEILKNVYGYNVLVCDQAANTGKAYVISNALPYVDYRVNKDAPDTKEFQKILLVLILAHIHMSNFPITEASLHSFLKYFQIDVNVRHPLFGQVKDYITMLVKQKFLLMETDAVSKKITYDWGIRAEKEISKHEIIRFVCKIFNDSRQPKSWTNQYRVACEQGFENERNTEENAMEVDF